MANTREKIIRFLGSMKFALLLLGVLALSCAGGSFITQNQTYAWYAETYSERMAGLIMGLGLDDVFHSWWFVLITAFLCVNLLLCNLVRLPSLLKTWRRLGESVTMPDSCRRVRGNGDPEALLRRLGFSKIRKNGEVLESTKNRIGVWGAWVCHLGILIVIAGFGFGQMAKKTWSVYGVPGQSKPIGDTGLVLTIDSFRVDLRPDDTVEQYTAGLTVRREADGAEQSAQASVNHPASLFGLRFYQNAMGWAANVRVEKDGQPWQEEVLCRGDYLAVRDNEDLVVYFNDFYPDFVMDPENGPSSAGSSLKNPAYLYTVYYKGQVIGMNVLMNDYISVDEYSIWFENPQYYTLIQITRDPFTPLALVGGLIVLAGLVLAFYLQTAQIRCVRESTGTWLAEGYARKGGALFGETMRQAAKECGFEAVDSGEDSDER